MTVARPARAARAPTGLLVSMEARAVRRRFLATLFQSALAPPHSQEISGKQP